MEEKVILVDKNDIVIGEMEKMQAHQEGLLHRAFSVFVFNSKGELLIHQRAKQKYHSGGLWTNTCCSHPRINESTADAAHRRLMEEMGFDCEIKEAFSFIYKAELDKGLTEHEFDHVFIGTYEGSPNVNKEEVEDFKWISLKNIQEEIQKNPQNFTEWMKLIFPQLVKYLEEIENKTS
jgi:isopentenyl-diphosphate Delta-isomerase